jgi:hypothetical protein
MDAKLGMISPAGSALTENHEGLMIKLVEEDWVWWWKS